MNSLDTNIEKRTVRKVTTRIIPLVFILYIISYLDRVNIGYAALEMNEALSLNSKMFGLATGIFFIGYFLFELPSNLLLEKFGARVWITRILVTWGILAVLMGFVQNSTQLYILRFLLGVAEAGFFPGIILYLTYWFRLKDQAKAFGMFLAAIPISFIIGAPLSTWIMDNVFWLDMAGWRWMFIIEGTPAVLLGIVAFFYLTDSPQKAKWLTATEKSWLISALDKERKEREKDKQVNPKDSNFKIAMLDRKMWYLACILLLFMIGNHGIAYWMPQIIRGFSDNLSNTQIGLIAIIPYIAGAIVMIFWSRSSDRTGERRLHAAIPVVIAAVSMIGAGMVNNPYLAMVMITFAMIGLNCFKAPFFALRTMMLAPASAAVSIAVINSVGNLGGTIGPYAIGFITDLTGDIQSGLLLLSGFLFVSALMIFVIQLNKNKKKIRVIRDEKILN